MNVCPVCHGERWVCEDHLDCPWGVCGCGGAGAPCPACNTSSPPEMPDGYRSLITHEMRKCVVTFKGHSIEIETESLYRAVIAFHTHAICGFADAAGFPVPGMDDVLTVETDGPDGRVTYRVRYGDTRAWANREAERVNRK